ncbi:phosphoribosylformylglycinamidine synthase subunit PurS [bacterium 3DAC]|nr:phosphoribosylformylglycinamidine synthase subunit PurS [Dictyoglomota bacterium]UZN23779.1 phosphoribosylformylglycinamidine synthase subunit PurS [bacterium 3DAC]
MIDIQYKGNVRDPRGETIRKVLVGEYNLPVTSLRIGKSVNIEVEADSPEEAEAIVRKACEELLVNPVVEQYEVRMI